RPSRDLLPSPTRRSSDLSDNLNRTLDARVAELDRMISEQLSAVMHAPEFQQLESSWRGLHYLCEQTSTSATMKIKVLNAKKKERSEEHTSELQSRFDLVC